MRDLTHRENIQVSGGGLPTNQPYIAPAPMVAASTYVEHAQPVAPQANSESITMGQWIGIGMGGLAVAVMGAVGGKAAWNWHKTREAKFIILGGDDE